MAPQPWRQAKFWLAPFGCLYYFRYFSAIDWSIFPSSFRWIRDSNPGTHVRRPSSSLSSLQAYKITKELLFTSARDRGRWNDGVECLCVCECVCPRVHERRMRGNLNLMKAETRREWRKNLCHKLRQREDAQSFLGHYTCAHNSNKQKELFLFYDTEWEYRGKES